MDGGRWGWGGVEGTERSSRGFAANWSFFFEGGGGESRARKRLCVLVDYRMEVSILRSLSG